MYKRQDWVNSVCVSPDSVHVLTASDDKTARVWTLADGKLVRTLEGHTGMVRSVCVSPDKVHVLTASDDRTARVWTLADGALVRTLEGHAGFVFSACVSPDGVFLFVVTVPLNVRGKTPARVYRYLARLS